jgi:hypothetical protein
MLGSEEEKFLEGKYIYPNAFFIAPYHHLKSFSNHL